MRVLIDWGRRTRALTVAVALGLCLAAHGDNVIDAVDESSTNDRPVYAFLSVTDTFDLPDVGEVDHRLRRQASTLGSKMICLRVGTFLAGPDIETTRFQSDGPVFFDPALLVPELGTGDPADFVGNHVTMVGSFRTLAPDSTVHLMTPYPQEISASVQEAYFNASALFAEGGLSAFPTTVEVALFIFDNQGTAGASFTDILQQIFHVDLAAPVVLTSPTPPIVTAEGVLFPHKPGDEIYGFDLDLDLENGILDADVCLNIEIDVKPGNSGNIINVKSDSGVVWIAVLTTGDFDAVNELDPDTVVAVLIGTDGEVVNEVGPILYDIKDVDGDGDDDIKFKFSVSALVDGPNAPLTTTSTSILFRGETLAGMCVQGADSVTVVPK